MKEQPDVLVFWVVVTDCLEEIYGLDHAKAGALSAKLRDNIEGTAPRESRTLFYHAEPIDVAGDLAGQREKSLSELEWKKYDSILARRHW